MATDATRVFVTALAVYAAFWNPFLQFSNASNFLDATVSLVETGRWELTHWPLYEGKDAATALDGRIVPGVPPGTALLLVPLYAVWRMIAGPVTTFEGLQALNAIAVLVVAAPAAALASVQVAWLAGWLGAGRRGRLLAALLFAFGTQGFQLGTILAKESVTALAVLGAFRLAVARAGPRHRAWSGALAAAATTLAHPAGLLAPLLGALVLIRDGGRAAVAFAAGALPVLIALAMYNVWLFGQPWRSGYLFVTGLDDLGFRVPKLAILADLLLGPRGGLFLYAPFLLAGLGSLLACWRTPRRAEAVVTLLFMAGVWLAAASWQSQFGDRASWAHGLGPRHLFLVVPLLSAFAGPALERWSRRSVLVVTIPALASGYLGAQAGFIPTADPLPYALKTWLTGTGMGVLFKEALPRWLGVDTLHTVIARTEVSASEVIARLGTTDGMALLVHQAAFLLANLLLLTLVGWVLLRVWAPRARARVLACES
jgi:hypothetical protein